MATPTVLVTATLNDPSGSALIGNSFLRFRLRGFQGFAVQVSTFAVLAETQIDALPAAGGAISQAIVPNNDISPSSTFYTVEAWNNGRILWSANYIFNGPTNLNTASPINTPPVPPGFQLVLENNGALNSSQSLLNLANTDGSVIITDIGGGTLNLKAAATGGGISGKWSGNWGGWSVASASGTGSTLYFQYGVNWINFNVSVTENSPTASLGRSYAVASAGGNNCAGYDETQPSSTLGILEDWLVKATLVGQTSSRYWIALWDQAEGPTTGLATLTPSANLVGFRWDSVTGGNIRAVCQTDSSHQTVVDTGVAPNASIPQIFEIVPTASGATMTFYINGALVATISTNVPATSVNMRSILSGDPIGNIGGTTLQTNLYYFWMLLAN